MFPPLIMQWASAIAHCLIPPCGHFLFPNLFYLNFVGSDMCWIIRNSDIFKWISIKPGLYYLCSLTVSGWNEPPLSSACSMKLHWLCSILDFHLGSTYIFEFFLKSYLIFIYLLLFCFQLFKYMKGLPALNIVSNFGGPEGSIKKVSLKSFWRMLKIGLRV